MVFWKKTIHNCIVGIFIFLPLSLINGAHAANDEFEFSLSVSNQNTYFNFPSNTNEVRSDQIGVNWYESFSSYFHAGLELGYIEMSQINNAITSAQFTSGEYVGILFRFLPVESPFFTLTLNLNYRYTQTKGKSTNQATQFSWDNTLLFSELQFQPTKHIGLILAAEYRFLDGVQRDSGSITQITPFKGTKQEGYRLGINFNLNRTQTVRLEWLDGYRQGVQVHFSHKY